MTASTATEPEPPVEVHRFLAYLENPTFRVALRWTLIGVLVLIAFRDSLASLAATTVAGGLNGYVWTIPIAAVFAAQGVARRPRTELPIHDRQTDVIVGTMGLVFALLLHGVLLQRYVIYFNLLRLDLLAMWVFVLSSAILLFGLRPVIRFVWVWAISLMMFTLPFHILMILLGGTSVAAGVITLGVAGGATGVAVNRTYRRGWIGMTLAWVVGLCVLAIMAVFFPDAPLFAYQAIPSLVATVVVSLAMFLSARRGAPKRFLDRKIEPVAAKQVLEAVPVVVAVAVLLALVRLPDLPIAPPARIDGLSFSRPLNPPAGWHVVDTEDYPWVKRLHGSNANLTRQRMIADIGNPLWDKQSRPRTIMVDAVVTDRPFSFNVYPAKVLYDVGAVRLSEPRLVDLGSGVSGDLVSVVDDRLLVTWTMLQWTWRNETRAQRVLLIAVDNHEGNAPFPQPSGALLPTLSTLFTVLFRGNSAVDDRNPSFKDLDLLTTFGRGLVAAQLVPLGRPA